MTDHQKFLFKMFAIGVIAGVGILIGVIAGFIFGISTGLIPFSC